MTTLDRPKEPIIASAGGIPYNKPWLDYWRQRALAAEDALSSIPEQGVGVKPLEWDVWPTEGTQREGINDQRFYRARALRPIGFAIFLMEKDGVWSLDGHALDDELEDQRFSSATEAKAAAQADYEARIRSAPIAPIPARRSGRHRRDGGGGQSDHGEVHG